MHQSKNKKLSPNAKCVQTQSGGEGETRQLTLPDLLRKCPIIDVRDVLPLAKRHMDKGVLVSM